MDVEEFIKRNEKGLWECTICGFTAMSKKVIKQHIKNSHPDALQEEKKDEKRHNDEKKNKEKKEKRKPRPWHSFEFEPLIDKEVTVVLRNGSIVQGILKYETTYNLVLTNATITGTKHTAKVEYLIINKSNVSHIHTEPTKLEPVEGE